MTRTVIFPVPVNQVLPMTLISYTQLKELIIMQVGASEAHSHILNTLKDLYKDDINSARRFEKIGTIGQLLKLLEIRNVLCEDNILPLKVIAQRLQNNFALMRNLDEYERSYVGRPNLNYYAPENLQFNDKSREPQPPTAPNSTSYFSSMSERKKERIIETITEEIGTFWPNLARYLKVRENDIDQIHSNYRNLRERAAKIMALYERKANPDRWFFDLCEALEKAHRRDLSESLKEIAVMNI